MREKKQYYVQGHYRRYPSAAKPHWIAVALPQDGMSRSHGYMFFVRPNIWSVNISKARRYKLRDLKKLVREELEHAHSCVLLRMD